jgi:spermidine synthase
VESVKETPRESYFWFREPGKEGVEIAYLCDEIIYSGRSLYQQIDIVNTVIYGRMLFLDGVAQSSESDEFIYHEMLVHPALFSHPAPKTILLIGGAEGAGLREIFRHPGIERVVMVDVDGELIEICKHYLPQWHQGTYEDSRLELIIRDGREYVERTQETFDAIIVDLSDPLEGSPAVFLFTREFYQLLKKCLNPGGCATIQGEGINPQGLTLHARMVCTLKSVFLKVLPYPYFLQSFHRPDAHILVTLDEEWSEDVFVERVQKKNLPLRYFSAQIAKGMFYLPSYLYEAYETQDQLLTDESPGSC